MFFSSIYSEKDTDEKQLTKEAYANMHMAQSKKIVCVYLYYNIKEKLIMVHIDILNKTDINYSTKEVLDMVEYIKNKRKNRIKIGKIGRNEMCPCGSGKKYKKCCLIK